MAIFPTVPAVEYEEGAAVSPEEYEHLSLDDPTITWELRRGRLREKPGMSVPHNRAIIRLGRQILPQLDEALFDVRINLGRVRHVGDSYYVPDLFVVAAEHVVEIAKRSPGFEVYSDPLPLVVEVWSPSTGTYDARTKLPEYQQRGDLEIWLLQPFERILTAWQRQADGFYTEIRYTTGTVSPVALPNVIIDLDALFAR